MKEIFKYGSDKKSKIQIRKYFQISENEHAIHQNAWDAAKLKFREKSTAVNTYVLKRRKIKFISFMLHFIPQGTHKKRAN